MSLSVVIPVFDEELVIERCLQALATELDEIDEIIVVDNNSTDRTAEIVAQMQSVLVKVRLIQEFRPGLVPARNAGIDAAKSDIVARIDADTLVQPGWAAAIAEFFDSAAPEFGAALGPFTQYDMPLQGVHSAILRLATSPSGEDSGVREVRAVYGANMVVRRSAWEKIRQSLSEEHGIWEDLDISLSLGEAGYKIAMLDGMKAQVSGRRMLTSRKLYWQYTSSLPRTLRLHGKTTAARFSWLSVWLSRSLYCVFWLPARTFDPLARRHSLRRLFSTRDERVIP